MTAIYHFSYGVLVDKSKTLKHNESPLVEKLDRLLNVLDEIKPQVDRFRLIEALTSKSDRV